MGRPVKEGANARVRHGYRAALGSLAGSAPDNELSLQKRLAGEAAAGRAPKQPLSECRQLLPEFAPDLRGLW